MRYLLCVSGRGGARQYDGSIGLPRSIETVADLKRA